MPTAPDPWLDLPHSEEEEVLSVIGRMNHEKIVASLCLRKIKTEIVPMKQIKTGVEWLMFENSKHLVFHEDRGPDMVDLTMIEAILRASHLNAPIKMIALLVTTWLRTYQPDGLKKSKHGQLVLWPVIAGVLEKIFHTEMPTGLNIYQPRQFTRSQHLFSSDTTTSIPTWESSSDINLLEYCDGSYVALLPGPRMTPRSGDWWYVPNARMPADPQNECWLCLPPARPIETTTTVGNRQADRFPAGRVPWRGPSGEFRIFTCRECACRELLEIMTNIMDQAPARDLVWDLVDALADATNNHRDNFRWQNMNRDE